MTPARVGVLYAHRLDVGGVETHLVSLSRRSDPARYRYLVFGTASDSFARRASDVGATIVPWAPAHALDLAALTALKQALLAHPVDVLHMHSLRATLFGRLVARRLGLPTVVTVHMPTSWRVGHGAAMRGRFDAFVEKRLYARFPDHVIHVSSEACREALARGTAPGGRASVIENGVDLEAFQGPKALSVREELATPKEATVVTCVARLDAQKGIDTLLESIGLLKPVDSTWRFWLVGDGPMRKKLEAHAQGLGLSGVRFLGSRADLPRLLRASDVFVLPSRYETTSLALLEAMAVGLPSVVTNVGDSRRLLGDGAGRVVPRGSAEALAASLRELLQDPSLRERLGAAARGQAQLYSDVRMAERTQEVYDTVLRARS